MGEGSNPFFSSFNSQSCRHAFLAGRTRPFEWGNIKKKRGDLHLHLMSHLCQLERIEYYLGSGAPIVMDGLVA